VIPDVLFATNSYTLEAGAKDVLDEFVGKVKSVQVDSVVVEGHTDSHGSMALNQQLSRNRAASVASYIQPHFQKATLTKAFASQKPVADNRTSAGRQKNRGWRFTSMFVNSSSLSRRYRISMHFN
jgi:outer membrane protein OmpA-like peptidoglycan-associated protein